MVKSPAQCTNIPANVSVPDFVYNFDCYSYSTCLREACSGRQGLQRVRSPRTNARPDTWSLHDVLQSSWESLLGNPLRRTLLLVYLNTSPVPECYSCESFSLVFGTAVANIRRKSSDMNAFIMDYLVSVGYPASAAKFAKEANIQPRVGVDTIKERLEVRDLVYKEDILSAIEKINDLDPLVSSFTFRRTQGLLLCVNLLL